MVYISAFTEVDVSIRLRKNVLPGFTTDAAWLRKPMRDRRSLFVPEQQGAGAVCPASTGLAELLTSVTSSGGDIAAGLGYRVYF